MPRILKWSHASIVCRTALLAMSLMLSMESAATERLEEQAFGTFENFCLRLDVTDSQKVLKSLHASLAPPELTKSFFLPQKGTAYLLVDGGFHSIIGFLENGGCTVYVRNGAGNDILKIFETLLGKKLLFQENDGSELDTLFETNTAAGQPVKVLLKHQGFSRWTVP